MHNYFPQEIREIAKCALLNTESLEEIRIRCNKQLVFCDTLNHFVDITGNLTLDKRKGIIINRRQIAEMLQLITRNSIYAVQNEIKNGFVTLRDGSRVGLCGKCVVTDGMVENISEISSLNIRIAREVIGCGADVFKKVCSEPNNILIISPPGHGKTTLLRDMIRLASDEGNNVSVVDERCELAPIVEGTCIFDMGMNTDIMSDLPKDVGINMVLRTMNPQIIATDEIATQNDFNAISRAMNSGVKIFATFHGNTKEDFFGKFNNDDNLKLKFDTYIYVKKNNSSGRKIWWEQEEP